MQNWITKYQLNLERLLLTSLTTNNVQHLSRQQANRKQHNVPCGNIGCHDAIWGCCF